MIKIIQSALIALIIGLAGTTAAAEIPPKMKMTTPIPPSITTPDTVETSLGTLRFTDGLPDEATVQKVYDNLDRQRGVEVFLNTMPGASINAIRDGLRGQGVDNQTLVIFQDLMDSKSLFLTPNTETVYLLGWLDLKDGPMVVETSPDILGIVDDHWFRYVADLGNAGPDKGKGGKYLFVPPGYKGEIPDGYFVYHTPTYGNWIVGRGFLVDGDPKPAVESFKETWRQYPLTKASNPPETKFIDVSGVHFNTIHPNDFQFYEDVNTIVQEEPSEAQEPELLGQLMAIGIEKGKPFAPDARMKKILTDAVAIGNATARAIEFRARKKDVFYYPDKAWFAPGNPDGSYLWLHNGARNLNARTRMFYGYTGVTPAMFLKMVGKGSQYAIAAVDADKNYFDGSKTYKLHLPPNVPAKTFWSVVLYDTQTRSELQTDQRLPSIGSEKPNVKKNADGSYDVYFGPKPLVGHENNWVQTVPGKSWWVILRLYGALEPWFDKTWQPDDIEIVK